MATVFPHTRTENTGDRLGFSVFIAIAAHALVIFGIGFKLLQQQTAPPSLEVTLAQQKSTLAQEDAEFIAQLNQQGSGNDSAFTEITSQQSATIPDQTLQNLESPAFQQYQEQRSATAVLTSKAQTSDLATPDHQEEQQLNPSEQLPPGTRQQVSSLKAKLDQQQQQYSRLPRTLRLTTASTKAATEAAYLHYWINHVESIGNQNYPQEARRNHMYGDLRLAVTLLPDGTVDDVEILLSSGQRVLDQAAIRIVRMASPFSPLPKEMRKWDKLEIIRTWSFQRGNTLQTEN